MSIIDIIKTAAKDQGNSTNPVNVLYGRVKRVSPLQIEVHQKLTLTEEFLVLTRNVSDHDVDMTMDHTTGSRSGGDGMNSFASHTHTYSGRKRFRVHNGLKTGEKVVLLRVQGGHQFIVLDRVVG